MIRTIGLSVLTQVVASAGSFVVSLLFLRLLSLEDFGHYIYLFIFASFAGSVTSSVTATIYQLYLPRYPLLPKSYEEAYNGLNLLAVTAFSGLASIAAVWFGERSGDAPLIAIALFTLSVVAFDNIKLQAAANGRFRANLVIEAFRQGTLIAIVVALGLLGDARLTPLLLAHGLTGLLSCLVLAVALGRKASFRRLGWIARRHYAAARYLLPSTFVSFFHSSAVQLLVARNFGLETVGLMRAAELPYSALNPLKLSLNYFLPRAIFDFEQAGAGERWVVVARIGAWVAAGILAATLLVWAASVVLFPWLTKKDYPAELGFVFAAAYVFMMLLTLANHYLNVIGQSRIVFRQTVIGAVMAIGSYTATFASLGAIAAPLAILMSFLAMTVYAVTVLQQHLRSTDEGVEKADSPGRI